MKKLTEKEFLDRASNSSPNIIVIGKYTGRKNLIRCRCKEHGHEFETKAFNLLYDGTDCPECKKQFKRTNQKYTHEEFIEMAKQRSPTITILNKYTGRDSNVLCQCNNCKRIWETRANNVFQGTNCEECRKSTKHSNIKKTHEEFLSDLHKVTNTIEIQSEYVNAKTYVHCKCTVCGNEWDAKPANLLTGYGCRICANKKNGDRQRKSQEEAQADVHNIFPHIDIIGEYISNRKPVKCFCNICETTWEPTVSNLLKGEGCPHCTESHGERAIRQFLDNKGIDYVAQKRFYDLVGMKGGYLSYDFYLPNNNTLIEYQGIQHEKAVRKFGGDNQLIAQQEHDRRKKEYAINNGFNFLELWYHDDNYLETLNNYLNNNFPVTITA